MRWRLASTYQRLRSAHSAAAAQAKREEYESVHDNVTWRHVTVTEPHMASITTQQNRTELRNKTAYRVDHYDHCTNTATLATRTRVPVVVRPLIFKSTVIPY
eukprot:scaffold550571_cov16-Prasinocladus_malaysianus.AAC.1